MRKHQLLSNLLVCNDLNSPNKVKTVGAKGT